MNTTWTQADVAYLKGRNVLITGANSGLGLECAVAMAKGGATVILGCRNLERGREAMDAVRREATGKDPGLVQIDLLDRARMADTAIELSDMIGSLDVLINNGGVLAGRSILANGEEIHLASNHLGAFSLTGHLLGLLLQAESPRVVTISSLGHWFGRPSWTKDRVIARASFLAYADSKLANILFATELDRRAKRHDTSLKSVVAHPGMVRTALGHTVKNSAWRNAVMVGPALIKLPLPQEGVASHLRAATDPRLEGGEYIGPGGSFGIRGLPGLASRRRLSVDPFAAAALWAISEQVTGSEYSWPSVRSDTDSEQVA